MNISSPHAASLFADKTTRILRILLAYPQRQWHTRSLAHAAHVSVGLVSRTIGTLKQMGIVDTGGRGRGGFILLRDADAVLDQWTRHYDFAHNTVSSFFIAAPKDIRNFFSALHQRAICYALTLHSGANLVTNYFVTNQHHVYIHSDDIEQLMIQLSGSIPIQRLARGGNLHVITPYYKNSVFDRMQRIHMHPVVSNVQLYVDLFHFFPRGHDHALHLRQMLGDTMYE